MELYVLAFQWQFQSNGLSDQDMQGTDEETGNILTLPSEHEFLGGSALTTGLSLRPWIQTAQMQQVPFSQETHELR